MRRGSTGRSTVGKWWGSQFSREIGYFGYDWGLNAVDTKHQTAHVELTDGEEVVQGAGGGGAVTTTTTTTAPTTAAPATIVSAAAATPTTSTTATATGTATAATLEQGLPEAASVQKLTEATFTT